MEDKVDRRAIEVMRDVMLNPDQKDKIAAWGFNKTFFGFDTLDQAARPTPHVAASAFYIPPSEDRKGMILAMCHPGGWDNKYYDIEQVVEAVYAQDDAIMEEEKQLKSVQDPDETVYLRLAEIQRKKKFFVPRS